MLFHSHSPNTAKLHTLPERKWETIMYAMCLCSFRGSRTKQGNPGLDGKSATQGFTMKWSHTTSCWHTEIQSPSSFVSVVEHGDSMQHQYGATTESWLFQRQNFTRMKNIPLKKRNAQCFNFQFLTLILVLQFLIKQHEETAAMNNDIVESSTPIIR